MCTLCDTTDINKNVCLTCYTCSSVPDGLPVLVLLTLRLSFYTRTLSSWNCAYHHRMELSDGGCFPNLVRNCRWTIVTDRHSWNISTQNSFSLPFAAILVNCAPSGEMHNYYTPHIIKENYENFVIHRCNYILLSEVYCVWQVVKTPTVIFNNTVFWLKIFIDVVRVRGLGWRSGYGTALPVRGSRDRSPVTGNFSGASDSSMCPGSTQPLKMSTRR